MLRYVGAFGPATIQDAATWSRSTGLGEVFDRLRPRLHTYRDQAGREYFDVVGVSLSEADTPAHPHVCCRNTTTCFSPTKTAAGSSLRASRR